MPAQNVVAREWRETSTPAARCAGKHAPGQPAVPVPTAPVEPVQTVTEPTEEDWADFRVFCREMDLRDQDLMDARRELEYQDSLDAGL